MVWQAVIGKLVLDFIVGTLPLWVCSLTIKTDNANIKTAAIYNAITTAFGGILLAIGVVFLHTGSNVTGGVFLVTLTLTFIFSFWLLMWMYDTTFLTTIWLVIALLASDTLVEKVIRFIA